MGEAPTKTTLMVFARAPEPGAAKTRLIPLLGTRRAAALQNLMTERAVCRATASAVGPVELWCTPDTEHPLFVDCAKRFEVSRKQQCGDDLGARMLDAVTQALDSGSRALVIGTDCPALSVKELQRAADALAEHDAVIIPAEDGGYVLIGFKQCDARVFADVEWGARSVLEKTRANMQALRWRWFELPMTWDVDRPADFQRLVSSGLIPDLERALSRVPLIGG